MNNSDLKTIIKKFSYSNNNIICNEVDFYSTSDVNEKFLSLINTPINVKGLSDGYYKSQISFCENKYAWKELFKYTFKFKKKIIPYLDRCLVFSKEWKKITSKKNKDSDKDIDRLFHQSLRPGSFHPINFKFLNDKIIKKHIKFLIGMKNNYETFLRYISDDMKKNKRFAYKNNKTYTASELIENINKTDLNAEKDILYNSLVSNTSLSFLLCVLVSMLCESNSP